MQFYRNRYKSENVLLLVKYPSSNIFLIFSASTFPKVLNGPGKQVVQYILLHFYNVIYIERERPCKALWHEKTNVKRQFVTVLN